MIKILSGRQYPENLIPYIDKAINSIDIVIYDWRFYPDEQGLNTQLFNNAIIRAINRKVEVRAIINNRILEIYLKKLKIKTKVLCNKGTTHAKVILIDRKIACLGSHNFTKSGFNLNIELSCLIDSTENSDTIQRIIKFFNALWQR